MFLTVVGNVFFSSCLIVYQPSCEVQKTYIPKLDTFHINTLLDSKRLGERAGMGETVCVYFAFFRGFWAFLGQSGKRLEDTTKKSRPMERV